MAENAFVFLIVMIEDDGSLYSITYNFLVDN